MEEKFLLRTLDLAYHFKRSPYLFLLLSGILKGILREADLAGFETGFLNHSLQSFFAGLLVRRNVEGCISVLYVDVEVLLALHFFQLLFEPISTERTGQTVHFELDVRSFLLVLLEGAFRYKAGEQKEGKEQKPSNGRMLRAVKLPLGSLQRCHSRIIL